MNKELRIMNNDWQAFFCGKKITVMGLGLLGRGVGDIDFLAKYAKEIIVTDLKTKKQLKESIGLLKKHKNIVYTLGRHDLKDFENRDFILKAAGVPLMSPYVAHARKNKIPVYMSTALFAKLSPAKIVGITGTRGKTSVTYMIFEALKKYYKNGHVFLGGNIKGVSTLALLPKTRTGDIAVLELDSWQLQGFGDLKISPNIAIFTTFMPDHLDYYGGKLKKYFADKAKIYLNQKKGDVFIMGSQAKIASNKLHKIPKRTLIVDADVRMKLKVQGEHNKLNASLAYVALKKLGMRNLNIERSLANFKGVSGRLELLRSVKGVKIYNDTTATTPHATIAAINALQKGKNIILVIGGHDKKIDLGVLKSPINKYCKFVAVLDSNGGNRLIKEGVLAENFKIFKNLKQSVVNGIGHCRKGDILLLSPAFASFGMFKNEYDRGEQFEKIVRNL